MVGDRPRCAAVVLLLHRGAIGVIGRPQRGTLPLRARRHPFGPLRPRNIARHHVEAAARREPSLLGGRRAPCHSRRRYPSRRPVKPPRPRPTPLHRHDPPPVERRRVLAHRSLRGRPLLTHPNVRRRRNTARCCPSSCAEHLGRASRPPTDVLLPGFPGCVRSKPPVTGAALPPPPYPSDSRTLNHPLPLTLTRNANTRTVVTGLFCATTQPRRRGICPGLEGMARAARFMDSILGDIRRDVA